MIAPPQPRPGSIVDPRIGDLGPALLALEDGTVFPGIAFGAPRRGRRRPRRQHEPDRLPGGLHRPLVRRPGRRHDLPAHRQLRPPAPTTTSRSGRGCGRSSWPTRRPPSSTTPASSPRSCATRRSRRSPAWTPGRSPATCARTAACAAIVTAPGDDRSRRGRRGRPGRAALGGPGLRRPGLAAGDHARSGDPSEGGPLIGDRRLRAQGEHRPVACAGAAPGSGSCRTRSAPADALAADIDGARPLARSRRPGPARRPGRAGPGGHRRRPAAARDLPRPPDRRPGRRRRHAPAPLRPSRREPPGPRRRPRASSR